jgi:succinate dehydrogenase/fumarate reductase-like Fe-S protein
VSETEHKNITMMLARLRIWRGTSLDNGRYDEFDVEFENGDSVLDGLVRLRYGPAPDLAFQFSCFNANVCKECAVMIDGAVDYACIAKLKPGLTQLDPVAGQRILRDLLIDTRERDIKGAMLRHQIQAIAKTRGGRMPTQNPADRTP